MDYFLIVIGFVLMIGGIIGCLLPVIPGPPLSFVALLVLQLTRWGAFSTKFLIIMAVLAIGVTIIDYLVPAWGTKKFGGSKYGTWGALIGMLIGLFFGPLAVITFPFVGAFVGELINGKDKNNALHAALGSFIGIIAGTLMKFVVSGLMTYYFVAELFF